MRIKIITIMLLVTAVAAMPLYMTAKTPGVHDRQKERQWRSMENGPWDFAPDWYY